MDHGDASDEELMVAYVQGDHVAFRVLFDRHARRLTSALRRGGLDQEACQELLQQTFLLVHRARHDFDPNRSFKSWVTTIALNLKRDHLRRHRRNPVEAGEGPAYDNAASASRQEAVVHARQLREALHELPAASREVVELHWFGGLSMSEVAEAVGSSHGAVRVRAHRAYKLLRGILGGAT